MNAAPLGHGARPPNPFATFACVALTLFLASRLWLLCDDAYITFRYVHNAHAGHGLVWNPAPFAPVEGYTSFSWSMLLWAAWSWLGVEPPRAANVLSLACGALQVLLVVFAAHRLRDRDGRRASLAVVWLTIAVAVCNRSFVQWMTSGLETSLFNLTMIAWALLGWRAAAVRTAGSLAAWTGAAALAALTRPDGLLLVAATSCCALLVARPWRRVALGLSPLAAVAAHVLWRRGYYGEWLPNTYHAKVVAPWPESGWRYLQCYLAEHGTWLLLPIAFAAAVAAIARLRGDALQTLWHHLPRATVVATLLAHAGYYVLCVGGDHFEYRVFSHLPPLAALATAAMLLSLSRHRWPVLAGVAALGLLSCVGWLHLALTHDDPDLDYDRIAPRLPTWLQPAGEWYDRRQGWLQAHLVCVRANKHRLTITHLERTLPPRRTRPFDPDDPAVLVGTAVGLVGWNLPDVAILDRHGLNDAVVARAPIAPPDPADVARTSAFLQAQDADGDGWIDRAELRAAMALLAPGAERTEAGRDLLSTILLHAADERRDAIRATAGERVHRVLFARRLMAHERLPPDGYFEAFEPNAELLPGACVITPRARPLSPERVRRIEADWRRRVDP